MDTESESTVRVPVRIHPDGRVTLLYENVPLEEIFTRGIGELVVPATCLTEQRWRFLLTHQVTQTIAGIGETQ